MVPNSVAGLAFSKNNSSYYQGTGGGLTGLFKDTASQAGSLLIAGGGGGGNNYAGNMAIGQGSHQDPPLTTQPLLDDSF